MDDKADDSKDSKNIDRQQYSRVGDILTMERHSFVACPPRIH